MRHPRERGTNLSSARFSILCFEGLAINASKSVVLLGGILVSAAF